MSVDVETLLPEVETVEEPKLPDVEVSTDAPADKEPPARAEDGKFAPKDGKKEEPKAKDEPKPEPKVEPKQEPRTIPLASYLEDKRTWQTKLEAMENELKALKNPPKAPDPEPQFQDDPKGYTDHKVKSALEMLEKQKQEVEQVRETAQMSAQQAEILQFSQHLQAAEAAFVKEAPDYYDALSHVREVRANQLKLLAPGITDEQIVAQIRQEETGMAMQLARAGRNPIQTVYELARAYGYQKKQPAAETPQLPNVPKQQQLPPDQTLGTGGGSNADEDDVSNKDPFMEAFGEMFGKRKAS